MIMKSTIKKEKNTLCLRGCEPSTRQSSLLHKRTKPISECETIVGREVGKVHTLSTQLPASSRRITTIIVSAHILFIES